MNNNNKSMVDCVIALNVCNKQTLIKCIKKRVARDKKSVFDSIKSNKLKTLLMMHMASTYRN